MWWWWWCAELNEERWREGNDNVRRTICSRMYPFDNHTKHDAASNSDKAGNLPKVTIVKHFFAVGVQRPVVSFARVIFVSRYLAVGDK